MKGRLIVIVVLVLTVLAACDNSEDTASNEPDGEIVKESTSGEGDEEEHESKDEVPHISEEAINHAYDVINDYDMVKDPHIEVSKEDKKITLAIVVNAATNEEHAKDLGDNFARALASGVSIYSEDDLKSTCKINICVVYDSYDF